MKNSNSKSLPDLFQGDEPHEEEMHSDPACDGELNLHPKGIPGFETNETLLGHESPAFYIHRNHRKEKRD